jgi:hypothetical protein
MGEGDDGNEDRTKDKDGKCPSIVHIYIPGCLSATAIKIDKEWEPGSGYVI